jgi:hypothetical protein
MHNFSLGLSGKNAADTLCSVVWWQQIVTIPTTVNAGKDGGRRMLFGFMPSAASAVKRPWALMYAKAAGSYNLIDAPGWSGGNGWTGSTDIITTTTGYDLNPHMFGVTDDHSTGDSVLSLYIDGVFINSYTNAAAGEQYMTTTGDYRLGVQTYQWNGGTPDAGTSAADFQAVTEFEDVLLDATDMLRLYNAGKL